MTRSDSLIALPRSVSPRGAESGESVSSVPRRKPRSVVSGHSATPVLRNATSEQRSPSRESMRSATSAFARSSRLGPTSLASIDCETSIAMTRLRLETVRRSSDLPHCGRAAARNAITSPADTSISCSERKRIRGGSDDIFASAISRRAISTAA